MASPLAVPYPFPSPVGANRERAIVKSCFGGISPALLPALARVGIPGQTILAEQSAGEGGGGEGASSMREGSFRGT